MQLNGASSLSFLDSQFLSQPQGSGLGLAQDDSGLSFMQMLESIQNSTVREGITLENKSQEMSSLSSSEKVQSARSEEDENSVEDKDDDEVEKSEKTSKSLNEEELAWLFMKDKSQNDNDFNIPLEEYTVKKSGEELLKEAQNLSVESPEDFLNIAEVASENLNADNSVKKILAKKTEDKENAGSKKDAALINTKKNTKSVFTVVDERTKKVNTEENTKSAKKGFDIKASSHNSNQIELTLTLNQNSQNNILSSNSQSAAANGSNFQAMLTQQLQHNAPDFVKAGTVVLKDNNQGTINMILKPESLGNVKVKLNLSDKVITGEITVHSQEAYDAFKESIGSLKAAFQQSGFETAGFELSLASDGSNQNHGSAGKEEQQNAGYQFYSDQVYGELVEGQSLSSDLSEQYEGKSIYTVDFVA